MANFTSVWIFAVTWAAIYESEVEFLLNSVAYDHVCSQGGRQPVLFFRGWTLARCATPVAARYRLTDEGEFVFRLENGQIASVEFQVMNVKRCIFSIKRLIEQGSRIDFERQVLKGPDGDDRQAQIHRQGRLYHLRAQLLETERSGSKSQETKKR